MPSASVPDQRSGAGRRGDRGARRAAGFPDRRPHAARRADRRRLARRPRPTCCSSSSPTSPAASGGRRRRRSPPARIPDGDAATLDVLAALAEIPRRAARSGSLHRGARSAAAAALFDLVLAQGRSRARVALTVDAVRYAINEPQAARRRLDLPRRAHQARRHGSRSTSRRRSTSACRPIRRCRSS